MKNHSYKKQKILQLILDRFLMHIQKLFLLNDAPSLVYRICSIEYFRTSIFTHPLSSLSLFREQPAFQTYAMPD